MGERACGEGNGNGWGIGGRGNKVKVHIADKKGTQGTKKIFTTVIRIFGERGKGGGRVKQFAGRGHDHNQNQTKKYEKREEDGRQKKRGNGRRVHEGLE